MLNPGDLNAQWPALRAGDVVHLNPGRYTGGAITLSVEGTSADPVRIVKTPGTVGKVVFDGQDSVAHLFNITGAHIEIGGQSIGAGWEPDLVIEDYTYAGIRIRDEANDLHLHHIHFLDIGTSVGGSNGFGVRMNGHRVVFEYNRIEDPAADALQAETGGGTDIADWTIRYNYGHNRSDNGRWAWNAASHADFVQIQQGPARDLVIHDNLLVGYTNALLLGDSWGSVTDVTMRDNFVLFEANGVSTSSKGDLSGTWIIEDNHFVLYELDGVDGGGRTAVKLENTGGGTATVSCNVLHGELDLVNVSIDASVALTTADNLASGRTHSLEEIDVADAALGYTMAHARDLSRITPLTGPRAGASCTQGASFTNPAGHLAHLGLD